jgi:glycogen debranching enzyme
MPNSAPATELDRSLVRLHVRDDACHVSYADTVLVTGKDGFIEGGPDEGLFVRQTRLLSRYRLRLGGYSPLPVALSNITQDRWMGYYILAAQGSDRAKPQAASQQTVELRIARVAGEGLHEDYDLTNYSQHAVALRLTLEIDGDFADIDETRDDRRQHGELTRTWRRDGEAAELRLDYRARHRYSHQGNRGTARLHRALRLRIANADAPPRRQGRRIHFDIRLPPQGRWHACLLWIAEMEGETLPVPGCAAGFNQPVPESGSSARDDTARVFLDEATAFTSGESETLAPVVIDALKQARRDLVALRLPRYDHGQRSWLAAAGVPMFVALFGRDALNTAVQAAPLGPELLHGTLAELARWQGRVDDRWRDEQPGRILHEAHPGPLKQLEYNPKGRYYGALTASSLYAIAVAQLWQWGGNRDIVAPLIDPALRALRWLDSCRAQDHGVFYAVRTRSSDGMENQTWKDSDDSMVNVDGGRAEQPVATCEEQGLVYAAKTGLAEVLWAFGRGTEAKRLLRAAHELRKRFNDAYWMEDEGCFAMGVDPRQRQVRSIGSNALHCLATGIADEALVARTLQRLFEPDLFNGWGIRTLSSRHPAYNPYAYHRGTVWPVEHGPFALGAQRYGFHEFVERICRCQFELASLFDYRRLPECLAGHPRDADHPFPSLYPAANAPQAWSAATVVSLVQALLGLQPFAAHGVLMVDPHLPAWLPTLTLHHLRVGDAVVSLRFDRQPDGSTGFEVLELRGALKVLAAPAPWALVSACGPELKARLHEIGTGRG